MEKIHGKCNNNSVGKMSVLYSYAGKSMENYVITLSGNFKKIDLAVDFESLIMDSILAACNYILIREGIRFMQNGTPPRFCQMSTF